MRLTAAQIEGYWAAILADSQLGGRRRCYVQTDVMGREPVKALPVGEVAENFDPFGGLDFSLDLRVRSVVEKREEEQGEEEKQKKEQVKDYGVLEGVLKYAGQHEKGAHVLLVGKPGSGKTTALEQLLAGRELIWGRLPVLVRLRDLDGKAADPVLAEVRRVLQRWGVACGPEQVEGLVAKQLFLLLDGVNEIPTGEGLRRAVQRFRERFQNVPMVFTTRALNVGVDLGIGQKLEMEPLSGPQMEEFARSYLEEQGEALLKQLGGRLREFAETPLLLWMLCGLFKQNKEVPRNLGRVFRQFVALYDTRVKGFDDVTRSWQGRFLRALALRMMPQEGNPFGLRLGVSRQEAEDILAETLRIPVAEAVERLDLLLRFHLLQLRGADEVEFKHQLFQEYFAAEGLLGQLPGLSDLELQKHYLNLLDWSEALALVAGLLESEKEALRLVRLGLAVDLYWGARLAGEVLPQFQNGTVGLVLEYQVPDVLLLIELLGTTASESATLALVEAMPKAYPKVRQAIIYALSNIKHDHSISTILDALNDPDEGVRRAATMALREVNMQRDDIIDALVQALDDPSPFVVLNAAKALEVIKSERAIGGLLRALNQGDLTRPRAVAEALVAISGSKVTEGLVQALTSKNRQTKDLAHEVLVRTWQDSSTSYILPLLESSNRDMRLAAARILGEVQCNVAVHGLVKLLNDPHALIRQAAVTALGQIGNHAAIPHLTISLNDDNYQVRHLAQQSILQIQGLDFTSVSSSENLAWDYYGLVSQKKSSEIVALALNMLQSDDFTARYEAVEILSKVEGTEALNALLQALKDQDYCVRMTAIDAIAPRVNDQVLPNLVQMITDDYPDVRAAVVSAIARIDGPKVIPHLLKALSDQDSSVRSIAAREIGLTANQISQHESQAVLLYLINALKDPDLFVRQNTVVTICKLGNKSALPRLWEALADENYLVRSNAAETIATLGDASEIPALWDRHRQAPADYLKEALQTLQNKNKRYNYDISQTPLPASLSPTDSTTINNFNAPVGQVNTGPVTIQGNNIGTQNNLEESHE